MILISFFSDMIFHSGADEKHPGRLRINPAADKELLAGNRVPLTDLKGVRLGPLPARAAYHFLHLPA
jgi:hypothetical protein